MVPDSVIFPKTNYTFGQVREMCRHNKALFSMLFFPHYVIPTVGVPDFHREIDTAFSNYDRQHTLILAPRKFAKSTRSFINTMHSIAYGSEQFIILASKTRDLAKDYIYKVKFEIESSQLFASAYGDMAPVSRTNSTWTKNDIICRNGVRVRAIGAGNQIRGINYGQFVPSLVVLDDPEDILTVDSAEERENIRKWFYSDVSYCVSQGVPGGQRKGRIVVIGNLIHSDCLVARLKEDPRFHVIYYQAIIERNGKEESLWPEYFPLEDLLEEKRLETEAGRLHVFMMERMNVAMASEDRLARESDLREWDGNFTHQKGMSAIEWNDFVIPVEVVTSIDLASRDTNTADFTVIMTTGMDANNNLYLIDYWKRRETHGFKILVALLLHIGRFHPSSLVIETTANQQLFSRDFQYIRGDPKKVRDYLKMEGASEEDIQMVLKSLIPIVHEVTHAGRVSKSDRIMRALQTPFRMSKIFHKPFMRDFVTEATSYPQSRGGHDDIVDTLEMCFSHSRGASLNTVKIERAEPPTDAYVMRDGRPIQYTDRPRTSRRSAWI